MGFVRGWGRLAALLVLCAMLSVVLAVAGPSADAQTHPADSCIGLNACTGLAVGTVGAGACVGNTACHNAAGPIVLVHVSATPSVRMRPAQ